MSVLNNVSVSEVDVVMRVEHVGGNVVRCDTPLAPLRARLHCHLAQKSQGGRRQPMRELHWAEQLVQDMQRHRGAPKVELSGDECVDADDIDVGTLDVVEGTWSLRRLAASGRPIQCRGGTTLVYLCWVAHGLRRMSGCQQTRSEDVREAKW